MADATPAAADDASAAFQKGDFVLYKGQRARVDGIEAPVPGDLDRFYNIKLEDGRDVNVPGSKLTSASVQSPRDALMALKAQRKAAAIAKANGIKPIPQGEDDGGDKIVDIVEEATTDVPTDEQEGTEAMNEESEVTEKKLGKKTRHQLHVLPFVMDYQRQHGLRHDDYERYRRFCSRRLRRLRRSLQFLCGKKHFVKKTLVRDTVTDERYLHILLFLAERAWAYYVQLKEEAKDDNHKKFHMVGRLRRAMAYANELSELVGNDGTLCDERTELETKAYASWMQALCGRERQSWREALESFGNAKHIYENLGGVCGEVNKPLYAKKVEEIDAQIRYCSFMLGESGAVDLKSLLAGGEMDMLKEKFARVVEDSDKSETDTLSSIVWRGRTIPVHSQKLQLSIFKIRAKEKSLEQAADITEIMEAYDDLFLEFGEAKTLIVDEIQAEKKDSAEADVSQLEFALDYMEHAHLEQTITRTMRMVDDANTKLGADGAAGNPDDIVRFYDMMLQNLNDMEEIDTLTDDVEFSKQLSGRTSLYKALRCLYLAQAQLNHDNNKEAVALLERGATHARLAQSEFSESSEPVSKVNAGLIKLFQEEVRRKRCLLQAKVFMKDMEAQKDDVTDANAARTGTLYDNLDSYESGARSVSKKPNLVAYPPAFVPTPCKPLFFDLASNYIEFPDVEKRAQPPKAERTGSSGGWGLPTFGLWGN